MTDVPIQKMVECPLKRGEDQQKITLGAEEIETITEGTGVAVSEVITTLRSVSTNVATLAGEVKT